MTSDAGERGGRRAAGHDAGDGGVAGAIGAVRALVDGAAARPEGRRALLLALVDAFVRFRRVGDGLACVVNALRVAVANDPDETWAPRVTGAVSSALARVADDPGLSFDDALGVVEALESAGLDVDDHALDDVFTALADASPDGLTDDEDGRHET